MTEQHGGNEIGPPRRGMVLGKFMPPHLGHVYLVDFARNYVEDLTVVVGTLSSEPIPGELRYRWMRELFPQVRVLHLTDQNPQDPSEHPDFWDIWRESLTRILPHPPDFVFASEDYGFKLAGVLGARFIPVDCTRVAIPVSGTAIRKDPWKYWSYLPRPVRPYFLRRVCIFGPESTGKSTLAAGLAERFGTTWVPEYARCHLVARGGEIGTQDIPLIARGQIAAEEALAPGAHRILFCDTDLLLTTIWSRWLYDSCPDWIVREADTRRYDLYLLTDVDLPWVGDEVRYLPEERQSFLETCRRELEARGRPYRLIRGQGEARIDAALEALRDVLGLEPDLPA